MRTADLEEVFRRQDRGQNIYFEVQTQNSVPVLMGQTIFMVMLKIVKYDMRFSYCNKNMEWKQLVKQAECCPKSVSKQN